MSPPQSGWSRLAATAAAVPRWFGADPYRIAAAGLLVLGFALRMVFLPDARLTGDEAFFYERALKAAQGEWLPWIGPPVSGAELRHPGGSFYLLMSLPLLLSSSPAAAMVWVSLLNVLAYGLLYATVRRFMGPRVGIAFLVLLVFSPWSFFYSDRIWNSNIVLVLTALFLWALSHVAVRPRSKRVFWAVFALVVFPQFHLSVPLLVFVALVVLVVYRPRLHWWATLGGLVAGAATYIPYLVQEARSGFRNTQLLLHRVGGDASAGTEVLRGLLGFGLLPTAEVSYFAERGYWFRHDVASYYGDGPGLAGMQEFFGGGATGTLLTVWMGLSVLLAGAGLVALVWVLLADRERRRQLLRENPLVPAFLAAPVAIALAFGLSHKPFFPHYIYPLYPLAFVPVLVLVWRLRHTRVLAVLLALLVAGAAANVAISGQYYRRVDAVVGLEASEAVLRTVYEVGRDRTCAISYDVEKSRLHPQPLQRLATHYFRRPISLDRGAPLRFRILTPTRFAVLAKRPKAQRRIDGVAIRGVRNLGAAVLVWADRSKIAPEELPQGW